MKELLKLTLINNYYLPQKNETHLRSLWIANAQICDLVETSLGELR